MPTAIVADDEPLLLDSLCEQLARLWPDLQIVGTASNGIEALAEASRLQPDFAFLDIRMPGLSGLDVAQVLRNVRVVFVTAHTEHALHAFDAAAADYLLKPVTDKRLALCIERLMARPSLMDESELPRSEEAVKPLAWLTVGLGDKTSLVSVADLVFCQARDKYTEVFTAGDTYLIRTPIKELQVMLGEEHFAQIHRSYIVRLASIDHIERDALGRQLVHLKGQRGVLPLSRSFAKRFRQM